MRYPGINIMIVLLALTVLLMPVAACAEPLQVFVSVLPLKTFVEKVGGEHVRVQALVGPGFDPHTYEPTPHQIAALSDAALFVLSGVPFEKAWMERFRSANPQMQVLDARAGIDLHRLGKQDHEHGEARSGNRAEEDRWDDREATVEHDPHVWTSPLLVRQMAGTIRDKLSELDPGNKRDYAHNYAAFANELEALDKEIRSLLAGVKDRRLMVFHPAWGYFADAYGLVQVPIESEGKEPGPRSLTALIEDAKRKGAKVIFVQPQFSRKSADQVARAIGGRVVAIDPLSADYAANLRSVARKIAEALTQ